MTIKNKRKRKYKVYKEFTYISLIRCLHNMYNNMCNYKFLFEVGEQQYKLLDDNGLPNTLGHCLFGINIDLNKDISKPRIIRFENTYESYIRDKKLKQILDEDMGL